MSTKKITECACCKERHFCTGIEEPSFGFETPSKVYACRICLDASIVEVIKKSNMIFNIPDEWHGDDLIDLLEMDLNLKARVVYFLLYRKVLNYF